MNTPSRRTFTHAAVLLGAGLFALGGSSLIPPLRALERQLLKVVAYWVEPVVTIMDGEGTAKKPWIRRKATPTVVTPPPRLLDIDDDPEGYFSASPLAPIDHAGIFASLREAGHKVIGVGHLMAWEESEPLAMDALRKQLDLFDAAVLALPLARGAMPEPVAAPFLRWSILESDAHGNVSALPQVNRIAVPGAEQGGTKSVAGFSLLENEGDPGEDAQPLLAQWGDRIVFAFPLAVEIAAEGLTPADLIVHVGKEIRIGRAGPVIPIDSFGRSRVAPGVEAIEAPAKRIVSEGAEPPKSKPLLTRDTRADLSAADKAWSDRLAGRIQALRTAPRYEPSVTLPRPDPMFELVVVLLLAMAGTLASSLQSLAWRIIASIMVAGLGAELLYLFAARQNAWLPPLALLCPGLIAIGFSFRKTEAPPTPAAAPAAAARPETAESPQAAAVFESPSNPARTSVVARGEAPSTIDAIPEPVSAAPSMEAEETPQPEPVVDPVEIVTALGFPAEYAWDPMPDSATTPPPAEKLPETEDPPPAEAPPPAGKSAGKAAKRAAKNAARKAQVKKAPRKSTNDEPAGPD